MKIIFIDLGNEVSSFFSSIAHDHAKDMDFVFFSSKPKPISILKKNNAKIYTFKKNIKINDMSFDEIKDKISPKVFVEYNDIEKLKTDALLFYQNLKLLFSNEKPDAIMVWNGSGLVSSLACSLAKDYDARCIYGENGYFPGTMQLDSEGANDYASIKPKVKEFLKEFAPTSKQINSFNELLTLYRDDKSLYLKIDNPTKPSFLSKLQDITRNRIRETQLTVKSNQLINKTLTKMPEDYVFVPLQVHGDSQLIIHSPVYGQDLDAFVKDIAASIASIDSELSLIVKLHPKDSRCYDQLSLALPGTIFVKDIPAKDLIRHARAIVTINSTVGFEALLFNKPVVTAGSNFYIGHGFTFDVNQRSELTNQLRLALSSDEAPLGTQNFCHFIYEDYLTHGNPRNFSKESKLAVSKKLRLIANQKDHLS